MLNWNQFKNKKVEMISENVDVMFTIKSLWKKLQNIINSDLIKKIKSLNLPESLAKQFSNEYGNSLNLTNFIKFYKNVVKGDPFTQQLVSWYDTRKNQGIVGEIYSNTINESHENDDDYKQYKIKGKDIFGIIIIIIAFILSALFNDPNIGIH